ncbi:MAG: right-handed parallel beta-helix repeat-containing protein [Candidatus Babeliales bacterium]
MKLRLMHIGLVVALATAGSVPLLGRKCCTVPVSQAQLGCINADLQTILNIVIKIIINSNEGCGKNIYSIDQTDIPYTISTPGHYCIQEDLSAPAIANAITITASNVTLDLNGFHITGGINGITSSGNDVKIMNGTVQGAITNGIAITGGTNIVVDNVVARNNGADGFNATGGGSSVIFNHSFATQNSGNGFQLAADNYDLNHVVSNQNGERGVVATGTTLTIHGSHVDQNDEGGILLSSLQNFCLENSTIQRNTGHGIEAEGTANTGLIQNNCVNSNTAIGITLEITLGMAGPTTYIEIIKNYVIGNGAGLATVSGIDIGGDTWINGITTGGVATTHMVATNIAHHNGATPGVNAPLVDTNYSQNLKALTSVQGELRTPVTSGVGAVENVSLA